MMRAMSSAQREFDSVDIQVLVDSIPALIHTAKPDGYLDYFNKPWLEYLGVTLDDVAGWNWTAFIHPEDLEGIVAKWRASLATGETFEYETRVRSAQMANIAGCSTAKCHFAMGTANIVKWYGSSLDIEERKTAEEQLRRQRRGAAKKRVLSRRRAAACPHGKLGLRSWRIRLLVSGIISDARPRSGQQTA